MRLLDELGVRARRQRFHIPLHHLVLLLAALGHLGTTVGNQRADEMIPTPRVLSPPFCMAVQGRIGQWGAAAPICRVAAHLHLSAPGVARHDVFLPARVRDA